MFCNTWVRWVAKKKVFELFCRETLLVNYPLRELTPAERRVTMTLMFKDLPEETLHDLQKRAELEESRLEKLQRAAATFKPLTPYEFFVKEQMSNPALGSSSNPREREVKLLQIYETLPDKAKEALASRADRYNAEMSKAPEAPAMPELKVIKKKAVVASSEKKKKKKKKSKKAIKKKKAKKPQATAKAEGIPADKEEDEAKTKKTKKAGSKLKGVLSPYSIFVKEQMASLHHLAPKERMRVIGERWRSLTSEERERRLAAARVQIAAAASQESAPGDATPAAPTATASPSPADTSAAPVGTPSSASTVSSSTPGNLKAASGEVQSPPQPVKTAAPPSPTPTSSLNPSSST